MPKDSQVITFVLAHGPMGRIARFPRIPRNIQIFRTPQIPWILTIPKVLSILGIRFRGIPNDSKRFLRIPSDSQVSLRIPKGSEGLSMASSSFLRIPKEWRPPAPLLFNFKQNLNRNPSESAQEASEGVLRIPKDSFGFRWIRKDYEEFRRIPWNYEGFQRIP